MHVVSVLGYFLVLAIEESASWPQFWLREVVVVCLEIRARSVGLEVILLH